MSLMAVAHKLLQQGNQQPKLAKNPPKRCTEIDRL
jgi:hypothetical protein